MKKWLILIALSLLVALSCKDITGGQDGPGQVEYQIVLSINEAIIPAEGGSVELMVASSGGWELSGGLDWCIPSKTEGNTGDKVQFLVLPNETDAERNAAFEFKCGDKTESFRIVQKQREALTLTSSRFEVGAEGGSICVSARSAAEVTFSIDEMASSWISPDQTKSDVSTDLFFIISPNDGIQKREGRITISSGYLSETVTVYQEGDKPSIVLSQTNFAIAQGGDTFKVEVSSNVDVEVMMPQSDWIRSADSKSISSFTFWFVVDENTGYDSRSAQIFFVNKANGLLEAVTVTQVQKNALVLSPESMSFEAEGGYFTVKVLHNVDYEISISSDWVTNATSTKALATEELVFVVNPNSSPSARECMITFRADKEDIQQIVRINQAATNSLLIGKKQFTVSALGETILVDIASNVDYEVVMPSVNWIKTVATKDLMSSTMAFVILPNDSYDSRVASIRFVSTDGAYSESVTVTQVQKDAIVIARDCYSFDNDGGRFDVELQHNVDYELIVDAEWITHVSTKGLSSDVLTFDVARNPSENSRETFIKFHNRDKGIQQAIKVVQTQGSLIVISKTEYVLGPEGGELSVEVNSNIDYQVRMPQVGWISMNQTKALSQSVVTFTVNPNTGYNSRNAEIVFCTADEANSQTVNVIQQQKDAIIISKDRYEFSSQGGIIEVAVSKNINYDVIVSDDWIVCLSTKAMTSDKVVFSVEANKTYDSRTGTVTFQSRDKSIKQTMTVSQAQMDAIILGNRNVAIGNEGGTFRTEVNSNIKYNVEIENADWVHLVQTKGLESSVVEFSVDPSSTDETRQARVMFSSDDGELVEYLNVIQTKKNTLILSGERLAVSAEGGEFKLEVSSGLELKYETSADWISLSSVQEGESKFLKLKVLPNEGYDSREASVKVSTADGAQTQTITVVQSMKEVLELSAESFNIPSAGGAFSFDVSSNLEYEVEIMYCNWIETLESKGITTETYAFYVLENEELEPRSARIRVSDKDGRITKYAIINQAQKNDVSFSQTEFEVSSNGEIINVDVTSNIPLEVSTSSSWISFIEVKASEKSTYSFVISPNDGYEDRTGTIRFETREGSFIQNVSVIQSRMSSLSISQKNFVIDAEGGSFSFDITTNEEVSVEILSADWIHDSSEAETKGLVTRKYSYTVDENTTKESRTARLFISSSDATVVDYVTVMQKQKNAIVYGPVSYDFTSEAATLELEYNPEIEYDLSISAFWITQSYTKASESDKLVFNISENQTYSSREGSLEFKAKDGSFSQTIKIFQSQKDAIILGQKSFEIASSGGTLELKVNSNMDYEVDTGSAQWIHRLESKALEQSSVIFTVDANDSYNNRTATIRVHQGTVEESFTVVQAQKDAIILSQEEISVSALAGTFSVDVKANVDYVVSVSDSWIKQVQTKVLSESSLEFEVEENPNYSNRVATVVLANADKGISTTLKVIQHQLEGLNVSRTEFHIPAEGGTFSFNVASNVEIEITNPEVEWLRQVETKALEKVAYSYEVDANKTYDSRSAKIIVSDKAGTYHKAVTITQAQCDAIIIGQTEFHIGSEGGTFSVKVGSNVEYDIAISQYWITRVISKALDNETLTFAVSQNLGHDSRQADIVLTSKDGNASQVVRVFQNQSNAIVLGQKEYTVSSSGEILKVDVSSNVEYLVEMPSVSWLHQVESKAMSDSVLYFEVDVNDTYSSRTAKIKLQDAETGTMSEYITITQNQKDAVVLAQNTYDIPFENAQISIPVSRNVDFNVNIEDNWLTLVDTKALATDVLVFNATDNDSSSSRKTIVTLFNEVKGINEKLTIVQARKPSMTVSGNQFNVSDAAGYVDIDVTSNVGFSVMMPSDGQWLHDVSEDLESTDVDGGRTVTVRLKFDENKGTSGRTAVAVIRSESGSLAEYITITQKQRDVLELDKNNFGMDHTGGTFELKVTSNLEYYIRNNCPWIHEVTTKGLADVVHTFKVDPISQAADRTGTFSVMSLDKSIERVVTVVQKMLPVLELSKDKVEVSQNSDSFSVIITSNLIYSLETDCDWITTDWSSSKLTLGKVSAQTVNVSVAANPEMEDRVGKIILSHPEYDVRKEIVVTQMRKGVIEVETSEFSVSGDGESLTIPVLSNTDYTLVVPESFRNWISVIDTKAMTGRTHTLDIAVNELLEPRTGFVNAYAKDGTLLKTFTICQASGRPFIRLERDGDSIPFDNQEWRYCRIHTNLDSLAVRYMESKPHDHIFNLSNIEIEDETGLMTCLLEYYCWPNEGKIDYECNVFLTGYSKDSSVSHSEVFKIVQERKAYVQPEITSARTSCHEKEVTVKLTSNYSWTVESRAEWCQVLTPEGYGNGEVRLKILKNPEETNRETTLTFTAIGESANNRFPVTVKITQNRPSDMGVGDWEIGDDEGGTAN